MLHHGPKKHLHRVLGCLTALANDIRPFTQSLSKKTEESYTLKAISCQTESTEQSPHGTRLFALYWLSVADYLQICDNSGEK